MGVLLIENSNTEQKAKELDELIDLAETVSSELKLLKSKLRNNLIAFTFSSIMAVMAISIRLGVLYTQSDISKLLSPFLLIAISIVFSLISIYSLNLYRKTERALTQEYTILNKLHDMITIHKKGFDSDLGAVTNAIYEMKLSRIEFNFESNSKNGFWELIAKALGVHLH